MKKGNVKPCQLCRGFDFTEILSLGELPLGFPVAPNMDKAQGIWREKYELEMCNTCFLIRTKNLVPDDKIEQENKYVSDTSRLITAHDESFVSYIFDSISLSPSDVILEIGCGDGSLLMRFWEKGYHNVIGVEPAVHDDRYYPFEVIPDFFEEEAVKDLIARENRPKVVIANYVIELIPDIDNFFRNISKIMDRDTVVIFEVPYFFDFMLTRRIDGFAHLRCLWYTVASWDRICANYHFNVMDIKHDKDYRGGTLRVMLKSDLRTKVAHHEFEYLVNNEKSVIESDQFLNFQDVVNATRKKLKEGIKNLARENGSIYGYGGGLKASTLINWLDCTSRHLKFTVDKDINKQNKAIPVANIPVKDVEELLEAGRSHPVVVLLLAIDHSDEIELFLKNNLFPGSKIVHLLPELKSVVV